jgi:hypothetical protein
MHTSAVPARWDCLTRPLYHSRLRARPGCRAGVPGASRSVARLSQDRPGGPRARPRTRLPGARNEGRAHRPSERHCHPGYVLELVYRPSPSAFPGRPARRRSRVLRLEAMRPCARTRPRHDARSPSVNEGLAERSRLRERRGPTMSAMTEDADVRSTEHRSYIPERDPH